MSDRGAAVHLVQKESLPALNGKSIWTKFDKPLETTVVLQVLYGTKWSLHKWRFTKKCMWVDAETAMLTMGKDDSIAGQARNLRWHHATLCPLSRLIGS